MMSVHEELATCIQMKEKCLQLNEKWAKEIEILRHDLEQERTAKAEVQYRLQVAMSDRERLLCLLSVQSTHLAGLHMQIEMFLEMIEKSAGATQ